jgi:hypothetical protein
MVLPILRVLLACAPAGDVATLPTTGAPSPSEIDAEPALRELASARLVFTGDLMMHGLVHRSAADADVVEDGASQNHSGYDVLFDGIRDQVRLADLAFLNLETPVTERPRVGVRSMVFNAPPVLIGSLAGLGFDAVGFSNNHVYDQRRGGFVETLDRLDAAGIAPIGAGRTCAEAYGPQRFDLNGIQVAFLGSTEVFNDDLNAGDDQACAAVLEPDRVLEEAAAARASGADIVLLSVHWGVEYDTAPQPRQVRTAHRLIEGGVDALIGHHPHVLQPFEVVEAEDGRRGLIVYSLGNLVSNQSAWYEPGLHAAEQGNPRDGLLLSLRLVKRRYGRGDQRVVRTELADVVATPLWTTNNTQGRDDSERVEIRVVPTRDRMAALDDALAGASGEAEIVRLSRERTEMGARWRIVGDIVGEAFLPPLR